MNAKLLKYALVFFSFLLSFFYYIAPMVAFAASLFCLKTGDFVGLVGWFILMTAAISNWMKRWS